ncbi:MAG: helix-turn-helix domain-containing protein [Sphingomonadales bacterium]|nr:MAG: helix-turn-helix domain-containing protein [Sphingomonadales bacterium]
MEGETGEDPTLFPATVGEKLRAAREAQGLELSEIAARTRIPQRHLEAIEKSSYGGLPSATYAVGFAKSYARAVGADEVEIARELRAELGHNSERSAVTPSYDIEDPNRVPPRGLAWAGAALALIALIGVALWYGTGLFQANTPPPETLTLPDGNGTGAGDTVPSVAPVAGGQVTLVASETVWIRVSDINGQRLFEKELAKGERYDVPRDADHPSVRTGGPEKIQVLLNGSTVAPLGPAGQTVDVEVSAAALQSRGQTSPAAPAPAPAATTATPRAAAPTVSAPAPSRPAAQPTPRPTPTAQPTPRPNGALTATTPVTSNSVTTP